ncbi:MAG: ketol-acid reductoisomerase, partial [Aliivibrio sp.]|nr:ketol-acid reductoisomerase [Aliivibrio sp.]
LESSFVAEVKSDLMGEQTILCGMLQAGSIVSYEKMIADGIEPGYAGKLLQYGWETITEALKFGGVTHMMDRLSNPAKVKAFELSEELKDLMRPLYNKHMDDIIQGEFSRTMMADWANDDVNLLGWREETGQTAFENYPESDVEISEQEYFDNGILLVAMVRAGVELAFEAMTASGIIDESAYYESLHELPLIANTVARKRLYEMNVVISDTAEYGNYLFANVATPLLREKFMPSVETNVIGRGLGETSNQVDNATLIAVNEAIRNHPVEYIGEELRSYMSDMKRIAVGG